MYFIVLDTNVVISALRSRRGASFAVLSRMGEDWMPLISVALILEYEAVGLREAQRLDFSENAVEVTIRAFCSMGRETDIHFRLRPSFWIRETSFSRNWQSPEALMRL